ncbi:MAG: carbon-nitrogen hydrolase family protein [Mariprofundaceae bacterium]|nr:carbon-nitrogen hydrolase family protein [Mariprofundaceae bacterium]
MSHPAAYSGASPLRAACVQMCSGDDVDANLARAGEWLKQAAEQGAELALLPENFAFMSADDAGKHDVAEPEAESRILDYLSRRAREHRMAVIGGSVPLTHPDSGKIRNACPVFSHRGDLLGIYDKIHLFDVDLENERYRESDTIVAGDMPVSVKVNDWNIGLSICYDIRFPELYRYYADEECHLLTVPAAFTVPTGMAHWETLLRARAIENQAYVLAAAQWGEHPGGRKTWGHSMIIDPWGDVMVEQEESEGVVVANLDSSLLRRVRLSLPALKHRKFLTDTPG